MVFIYHLGSFIYYPRDMKTGFTYVKFAYVNFTHVKFAPLKHDTMFVWKHHSHMSKHSVEPLYISKSMSDMKLNILGYNRSITFLNDLD